MSLYISHFFLCLWRTLTNTYGEVKISRIHGEMAEKWPPTDLNREEKRKEVHTLGRHYSIEPRKQATTRVYIEGCNAGNGVHRPGEPSTKQDNEAHLKWTTKGATAVSGWSRFLSLTTTDILGVDRPAVGGCPAPHRMFSLDLWPLSTGCSKHHPCKS